MDQSQETNQGTSQGTRKIRILVVEDSITIRKRLMEVLDSHPELEVVGEAADGKRAIELCQSLHPDVVTLDMMLPVMTGLAATEYIMAHCPTPILIVSASTNRGELFRTYDALAAGAVDVLEKPLSDEANDDWERRLVASVRMVSRIKVITHVRGKLGTQRLTFLPSEASAVPRGRGLASSHSLVPQAVTQVETTGGRAGCRAVAIGVSTGGPAALLEILRGLPPSFPLPVLLVIHIGDPFATAFAEWLDGQSSLRVAHAKEGEPLPPIGQGRVIMAPPNLHLVLRQGKLHLTSDPERHSCRPSVDVLFESMAAELGSESAACLLTGMGKDGARGLLAVRNAGGRTIAQDEATSVVFGMPREAIEIGAAERVLPLSAIAPALTALLAPAAPPQRRRD